MEQYKENKYLKVPLPSIDVKMFLVAMDVKAAYWAPAI